MRNFTLIVSWFALVSCASPGEIYQVQTVQADKLKIATWNLEWLIEPTQFDALVAKCRPDEQPDSNERSIPCPRNESPRKKSQAELDALARYAMKLDADLVALEETDGPGAARLIFRNGYRLDCFVSRLHPQKVGFAIREGIPYRCNPEYNALDVDGKTRSGADVTIYPDSQNALRFLAVHLKSGCFTERLDNRDNVACEIFRRQVPVLEAWMDARVNEGAAFAIMGDFNRRLELDAAFHAGPDEQRPLYVFSALNDKKPIGAVLSRATERQAYIPCSGIDHHAPSYIDNILVSASLAQRYRIRQFGRLVYDDGEHKSLKLSDHCPITMDLRK